MLFCCFFCIAAQAQNTEDVKKMKGGTISKGETALLWGVIAKLPNFEFDVKFKVAKYDFLLMTKSGEVYSASNMGEFFNDKIKKLIKMSKPGDVLVFENIMAVGPDNYQRNIGQIVEKVF
jgi:hypothetical protein